MRDSLPPGQVSISEVAERLGYTERRLRSIVREERWTEAPRPAGTYGLTLWWWAEDIDAFLRLGSPRLRRADLAHRLKRPAGYVSQLVTKRDFRSIPPPNGQDRAGDYWLLKDVDAFRTAGQQGDPATVPRSSNAALAPRDQRKPSALPQVEHVEQLASFVTEGHLYRCGDDHFLVYTGESGRSWDVSRALPAKQQGWAFGDVVVQVAADRETAISELRKHLANRGEPSV